MLKESKKILQQKTLIDLLQSQVDAKINDESADSESSTYSASKIEERLAAVGGNPIPSGSVRPTLTSADVGYMFYDTDTDDIICWNGTKWNDE